MPVLQQGDLVCFVSPASPPKPECIQKRADLLRAWGLRVEISTHAFEKLGYLAGTDEHRLADLSDAFLDPKVRAVFATRGGKGSYRLAHGLPFEAISRDPKPIIGFSDITCLQLALYRACQNPSIHGALTSYPDGNLSDIAAQSLRNTLMGDACVSVVADSSIASAALTTTGKATGILLGGSLTMLASSAGWALPPLEGAILLIESDGIAIGQFERDLTMLVRAGHLDGIAGIAIGHVSRTPPNPPITAEEILRRNLRGFNVPILAGLPIGHHPDARSVIIGAETMIDADAGTLIQSSEKRRCP